MAAYSMSKIDLLLIKKESLREAISIAAIEVTVFLNRLWILTLFSLNASLRACANKRAVLIQRTYWFVTVYISDTNSQILIKISAILSFRNTTHSFHVKYILSAPSALNPSAVKNIDRRQFDWPVRLSRAARNVSSLAVPLHEIARLVRLRRLG